jgi:hypothetical protein
MTTCVECGNDLAVTRSSTGMICRQCQHRRNMEIGEQVRAGRILTQGVDPDGRPLACCVDDCTRDAVVVTRMPVDGREIRLMACNGHVDAMTELIAELRSGRAHLDEG